MTVKFKNVRRIVAAPDHVGVVHYRISENRAKLVNASNVRADESVTVDTRI